MATQIQEQSDKFDFERHEQVAVAEYLRIMLFYAELASSAKRATNLSRDKNNNSLTQSCIMR